MCVLFPAPLLLLQSPGLTCVIQEHVLSCTFTLASGLAPAHQGSHALKLLTCLCETRSSLDPDSPLAQTENSLTPRLASTCLTFSSTGANWVSASKPARGALLPTQGPSLSGPGYHHQDVKHSSSHHPLWIFLLPLNATLLSQMLTFLSLILGYQSTCHHKQQKYNSLRSSKQSLSKYKLLARDAHYSGRKQGLNHFPTHPHSLQTPEGSVARITIPMLTSDFFFFKDLF